MSLVKTSPAVLIDSEQTMPPSEMQAISDVDDHVAFGGFDVESRAERRGHRFVDHVDFAASGVFGRVAHGAYFDVGRAGGNADHHAQRGGEEAARGLDLLDHAAQHQLRGVEVGDHAVFERTDGLDVRVGLLVHLAGLLADGHEFARVDVQGHDRRFVDDDLAVVNYQRVGRSEVDGQLLCQ